MTYYKVIFATILISFLSASASARMITPEDPYHNRLDGGSAKVQKSAARKPASEPSAWDKIQELKDEAVDKISKLWNWREEQEKQRLAAEKKAKEEAKKRKVEQLASTLPAAQQTTAKESFRQLLDETKKQVESTEAIAVASPGRKGSSDLPLTKAKVPVFDLVTQETKTLKSGKKKTIDIKVENIPRLDIGTEKSIVKSDFLPLEKLVLSPVTAKANELQTPKALTQSDLEAWTKKDIKVADRWTGPKDSEYGLGKVVTETKVAKVNVEMTPEKVMEEFKELHNFNATDRKMLMALILNNRGDACHIASGLFHDLISSDKYKDEATFHLGVCAHKMGFHSEAVARLMQVIKGKRSDYISDAIENLVEDLPSEFEEEVAKVIEPFDGTSSITAKAKDYVNYIIARAAYKKGQHSKAAKKSDSISRKHPLYYKAQYLHGISLYAQKSKQAEPVLTDLLKSMKSDGKVDNNLVALANINLGRMKFLQKRYEAALQNYKDVPKNHALWVDALIEQGWIQLNTDDAAGAIGNMYSLHSPYFKSVYMPESWVVRTIGYIDICQYGDAYRSLTKLENQHADYAKKVSSYLGKKPSPSAMYSTVKNYIRGKSDKEVDGLPAQVVREVARQKRFLNAQGALNTKEDELTQYGFIQKVIAQDIAKIKGRRAAANERKRAAQANIAKIKDNKELEKNRTEWQASVRAEHALIRRLNFEIEAYEEGRKGYGDMRKIAERRIEREKNSLKNEAGKVLLAELSDTKTNLYSILEGNEFLRYEIFAGSGEDIRYQAAGGKTQVTSKIPANVKPQKILNWEFDGEYWEDEIGSYRSTLTNNCPKRTRSTASIK